MCESNRSEFQSPQSLACICLPKRAWPEDGVKRRRKETGRAKLSFARPSQSRKSCSSTEWSAILRGPSLGYYVAMRCNKLWGYSSLRSASSPRLALRISPRETSENARRQPATSSHQLGRTPRLSKLPPDGRRPSRNCSVENVEEETPFHCQTPQEWGEVGETWEPRGRLQGRVGANSMLSHRKFVLVTLAVFSRNKTRCRAPLSRQEDEMEERKQKKRERALFVRSFPS